MQIIDGFRDIPHITSQQVANSYMGIIGPDDYVLPIGKKFAAEMVNSNLLRIQDGAALLQGHRCEIEGGNVEEVIIENGTAGATRNDIVVIRYTKDPATLIEDTQIVVVKGTNNAGDPVINNATVIRDGANTHDMMLYRVRINGISIAGVDPLFKQISQTSQPGGVSSAQIADGAITAAKIADGAISAAKLAIGAAIANIANGAITSAKLANGAITSEKLAAPTTYSNPLEKNETGSSYAVISNISSTAYKLGRMVFLSLSITTTGWGGSGPYNFAKFTAGTLSALKPAQQLDIVARSNASNAITTFYMTTAGLLIQPNNAPTGSAPDTYTFDISYISAA